MSDVQKPDARYPSEQDPISLAMEATVNNVRNLALSIRKMMHETNTQEPWFGNLLVGILDSALHDYGCLKQGRDISPFLLAWGRRNLLELRYVSKYILTSRENAEDFKNELAIDAKEFYEAVSKIGHLSHKQLLDSLSEHAANETGEVKELLEQVLQQHVQRGPGTTEVDAEAAAFADLMKQSGSPRTKPRMVSELAQKLQEHEQFGPVNKICSKIMHRTCLSIASSAIPNSLNEIVPLLYNAGCVDLLNISETIANHLKMKGVQAPD